MTGGPGSFTPLAGARGSAVPDPRPERERAAIAWVTGFFRDSDLREAFRLLVEKDPAPPSTSVRLNVRPRESLRCSEAGFFRSFDRLEEILQGALVLQVGSIGHRFDLRETVLHLESTGFLSPADRSEWAACLAVRHRMLLADAGGPPVAGQVLEEALARMMRLEVAMIDRRLRLFTEEQSLRREEESLLRRMARRAVP
jgi:hypothetical protein